MVHITLRSGRGKLAGRAAIAWSSQAKRNSRALSVPSRFGIDPFPGPRRSVANEGLGPGGAGGEEEEAAGGAGVESNEPVVAGRELEAADEVPVAVARSGELRDFRAGRIED